jgi:hypothetical protein
MGLQRVFPVSILGGFVRPASRVVMSSCTSGIVYLSGVSELMPLGFSEGQSELLRAMFC